MSRLHTRIQLPLLLVALATPARAADVTVTLDAGDGFVVENNTATIERLRVAEDTGNVSRNGALFVHTTGTDNTFVGENAGNPSTLGAGLNSAFGKGALSLIDTGSRNSAFGSVSLNKTTTGAQNSAFGYEALTLNDTGDDNSAFGRRALSSNVSADGISAFGALALESFESGTASAFGSSALQDLISGTGNAAFGHAALWQHTSSVNNSAFGHNAMCCGLTGDNNSAFGTSALKDNDAGGRNSGFGSMVLQLNTTGDDNTAVGSTALTSNDTGFDNTAVGSQALSANTTGDNNIGLGREAGRNQTIGSDNIYIDNDGVAAESGKIKIGNSNHTETFIEGIDGNTATGGVAVLINSSNELHTLVSSIRFKEAVRDMGEASDALMQLRPVTFRYREEVAKGGDGPEYGLIAEEVAAVAPELVAYDGEGQPYSVRYHVLPSLLLNEMQKQQRTIETLLARVEELEKRPSAAALGADR